ncbi:MULTISPECIES: M24 family metallopeptidase [Pontibacillus]|uniref:Xaa-Pro peptidase family protein n=1 Tax=Pontibacillus chungwhensis TaxID=265426 RepID=A0ABY8V143_9BACI|nr:MULTISPECIES: Xaa-Pro peptidase family protein [Pontibacillus]MCD5322379.1 Xaa-Pro peptidase family protein [Pontibacillus sp. HN14]WIF99666.1 Xaa-Pro peptidase family protein [Pontibacillus chungwhensis]
MKQRLQQLTQWMKKESVDVSFFNSTENVFYLTDFHTDPHERLMGLFVFQDAEPIFVVPGMEAGQVKDAGWPYEVLGYADHEDPWALVKDALTNREIKPVEKVAFEEDVLTYGRSQSLLRLFNGASPVSVEETINHMRLEKDEGEIEVMRRAAEMADYGVKVGVEALREGVTEMEVLAKIEYELKKKGIREMSFSTMVLFGEKSGQPHGNPGDRQLQKGDFVLFDLGVVLEGYTSDITRTFAYGSVSDEQRTIYETVLAAQHASLDISKPGTRIGDLDQVARDVIEKAGYGKLFPHRIGHGLGINVHEFPSMSHLNDQQLKVGMTYTLEPGIYDPNVGGVRIEDDVLITEDGFETLTNYPKELQIIE